MTKIGALIPVRLSSERLKQKNLKKICDRPMLYHLLDRVLACKYITNKKMIIVCTTQDSNDDPLVDVCKNYGVSLFRGSKNDLIHRFYSAINYFNLDIILQIDGDDPLTDTEYMNLCLEKLIKNNCDVTICENLPLGVASKALPKMLFLRLRPLRT